MVPKSSTIWAAVRQGVDHPFEVITAYGPPVKAGDPRDGAHSLSPPKESSGVKRDGAWAPPMTICPWHSTQA
jgi:hypothetical protein